MSEWLNTKKPIFKKVVKPCKLCGFCPYGQLVEEFPLNRNEMSCEVFGHDCPVFYHAEFMAEEEETTNEEISEMISEFESNQKGE